ncbi:hypothetical protein BJ508DRAFT_418493 [Ascobolus immersus RN42]|uniref:Spt20-like SEP domain-containing protein n=1 Tax=Ascobolus immersus RN42 TaxID=1160509 RepID=A0A3N4HRQ7_ASCIM|nr:hypothetical protein BJ508DRAFT_418493 [Ascobolus immersus RN42]
MTAAAHPITLPGLSAPAFPRVKLSQTPKSHTMAPSASAKYPPGSAPPSKLSGSHNRISTKTRPGASSPLVGANSDLTFPDTPTNLKKKARMSDVGGSGRTTGRPTKKAAAAQARDRELAASSSQKSGDQDKKANIPLKPLEPVPYVITADYILKKFKGSSPSLILHLHPNHFRLEGQEGGYAYTSPMKALLEAIQEGKVPHQFVTELYDVGVPFYDGCLIVQVNDHRTTTVDEKSTIKQKSGTRKIASINNYHECLTPSPLVPFPEQSPAAANTSTSVSTSETPKATSEIVPAKEKPKVKTFTTVLFPNAATLTKDIEAATMKTAISGGGKPGTPMTARTPVTARMAETKLDEATALKLEARALLLQAGQLILEPARNFEHSLKILDALKHPLHSGPPPKPKVRKRTNAEMQADEAAAAEEERMLLVWDEQRYPQSASSGTQAPLSAVANDQENVFKRFRTLSEIKKKHDEKKEKKEAHSMVKIKSTEQAGQSQQSQPTGELAAKQASYVQSHRESMHKQLQITSQQNGMVQHQLSQQTPFTAGVTGMNSFASAAQSPLHPTPPVPQRLPTPAQQQPKSSVPPSSQPTPRQATPVQNTASSPAPPPAPQPVPQQNSTTTEPPPRVPSVQPSMKTPTQQPTPVNVQPKPIAISQSQTPQQSNATLMQRSQSQQQQRQPTQQPQTRPQTPAANLQAQMQARAHNMGLTSNQNQFVQNQIQASQSPVQASAQAQAQVTQAQIQQAQQAQAQNQHAQALLQAQTRSPALSSVNMQTATSSPAGGFIQSPVPGAVPMVRNRTNASQSGPQPNPGFVQPMLNNAGQPGNRDMLAFQLRQQQQQAALLQAQRMQAQAIQQGTPQVVGPSASNQQGFRQSQILRDLMSRGIPQDQAIRMIQQNQAAHVQQQQAMANAAGLAQMNPNMQNLTPQQQQQQLLRLQQMRSHQILLANAQAAGMSPQQYQQLQRQQQMMMQQNGGVPMTQVQRQQFLIRQQQQQVAALAAAQAAQGGNPQAAMMGGVRIMPTGQPMQMQPGMQQVNGVNGVQGGQFQDMNGFVVPAGRGGINMNGMMNMNMGMNMGGLGRGRGG